MFPRTILALLVLAPLLIAQDWRDAGVLDLRKSPHARLHSVPVRAVTIEDGFWSRRRQVNVERSIPSLLALLEENGVVDNFRRLSGRKNVTRRGPLYTDSDLYKWMEAVAFVLQSVDNPKLRAQFDQLTDEILAAQEASGYLNTYFVEDRVPLRFQQMQSGHELYCLGHLLQAAVAYHRATGNRRLLDGALRFVEYLIRDFGPNKRPLLTGHPELELALVELYRTTGDRRHLDLAGYLVRGDGERLKLSRRDIVYLFSGKPFTERTKLEGHAVRAMYAVSGATDYFIETGDEAYRRTLDRLWQDMTRGKMYITGGVGSRAQGEAFGEPYELPNRLAYTESCAAIGNMIWNWRLLAATGEARFADEIERALYNGVNSGMSLDGTLYCYRNPLELTGDPEDKIRNPWYSTTCCPPNLQRVLASLPGYFYSTSREGLHIHLYDNNTLDWRLEDGTGLRLKQTTKYPWEGKVEIAMRLERAVEFTLFLRVPGWASPARAAVNGRPVRDPMKAGTYLAIRRKWQPNDRVVLDLGIAPRLTSANPLVRENAGRVAVERGPLVYCMEQADQYGVASIFDVKLLREGGRAKGFTGEYRRDKLGGIVELWHAGVAEEPPLTERWLYEALRDVRSRVGRPVTVSFIPYYAFSNRGPSAMQVWIPYEQ
ncbi:MAG TPA: beta-L-arabinofuranosidase domain-containing protein [Bryobacteraceae bacterium]|nr:beta-L-arabinofuranosidase domain-containing protein [Bryobacteraceae bacterium]